MASKTVSAKVVAAFLVVGLSACGNGPPDTAPFKAPVDAPGGGGTSDGPVEVGQLSQGLAPTIAPVLVGPTGSTNLRPTFLWNPIDGGAAQYLVWVNDSSGANPVKAVVTETEAGCVGGVGTCSFPSPALSWGTYRYYVRAQDEFGAAGPWSSGMSFVAVGSTAAPAIIGPVGFSGLQPTIEWYPVSGGAPFYYVWINNQFGTVVLKHLLTESDAGCAGGQGGCSLAAPKLPEGTYRLYVRAQDANGTAGQWSGGATFNALSISTTPPTVNGPTGTTHDRPTYSWEPVAGGAASYFVWVNDGFGGTPIKQTVTEDEAGCSGGMGTCSIVSSLLPYGYYRVYVRALDAAGNAGPWSAGSLFRVQAPCVPETCVSVGAQCGPRTDGCGGTLDCGTCNAVPSPICERNILRSFAGVCQENACQYPSSDTACALGCYAGACATLGFSWVGNIAGYVSDTGAPVNLYSGTAPAASGVSIVVETYPHGTVAGIRTFYSTRADCANAVALEMNSDGEAGNNDRWYAVIPAQPSGTPVCLWIHATGYDGTERWESNAGANYRYTSQ